MRLSKPLTMSFQLGGHSSTGSRPFDQAQWMHGCCTGCRTSRQRLTAFDIVVLSQHTALAVFTLDESNTITSQFMIPRNFLKEDLDRLKGLVRERFLGQTVLDIHCKIRTEIPQIIQRYFTTTDNVIQLFEHIFGDISRKM